MNAPETSVETYRRQLTEWALALTSGRNDGVYPALADGCAPQQLDLFTRGSRGKRFEKLKRQLEFVADSFDDFEDLLNQYIRVKPPDAYDVGRSDADGFLHWLARVRPLTPEQRDHVTCQRARHAVQAEARRRRGAHLHFQELWSVADRLAEELDANAGLRVHLNPLRVWARLETPTFLEEGAEPPQDVLFFARREDIAVAVVEPAAWPLVEMLAASGPLTVGRLCGACTLWRRDDLVPLCRDLAAVGLIAFS